MMEFSCIEVDISHSKMLELRRAGKLNLGMDHEDAAKIANNPEYAPKTTANAAFKLWGFVGAAGFFYTVYLSFTDAWWWFLIGIVGAGVLQKSNRKGHTENYLDAAMVDEVFYERLVVLNVWLYQMNEEDAAPFDRSLMSALSMVSKKST